MHDDDLSKTMLIPNPGGRRRQGLTSQKADAGQSPTPPTFQPQVTVAADQSSVEGENFLLAYARDILSLAGNLRTLTPNNTIEQLRIDVDNLFRGFSDKLSQDGCSDEITLTARYLLCCLVDELVLSTPWGIDSPWSHQTLLGKYHNETSGGEKFFLIANKIMEQPQRNLDLIELCYVCLSLGFRGKYRLSNSCETDIQQIASMLYQPISLYRPVPAELSPNWHAAAPATPSIETRIPPTLLFSILTFICAAFYIAYLSNLHAKASPLLSKVEAIAWDELITTAQAQAPQKIELDAVATRLARALQLPIEQGKVQIDTQDNLLLIRLVSRALFPSGSTVVNESALPDVHTLVQAILPFSDSIIIVGHTDATGRAESNWAISRQRAEAVQAWIHTASPTIKQSVTRGLADTQPLVDSRRASENRRVEIILLLKEQNNVG